MDITEDVDELVAQTITGGQVPRGMDLEALQGFLLKFMEDRKNIVFMLNFSLTGYPIRILPGQPIEDLCLAA